LQEFKRTKTKKTTYSRKLVTKPSFNSRGGIQTSTESAYFSHAFGVPSNATHLYEQYGNNDAFTLNSRIGDTISLLYDGWMMNLVADVPGQKSYNQLN
jgi:hypothetical protein